MNTTDTTDTESALIRAAATALLHLPPGAKIGFRATGTYRAGNRTLVADFGPYDVGPLIGSAGGMKLAIQTILAWPGNADDCQFRFETKRLIAPPTPAPRGPSTGPIEAVLRAIRDHLAPAQFEYRVETSATAAIAVIEADPMIARDLRGPISKLIRGIGRCQGYPAMVGLERTDSQSGRNSTASVR